MSHVDKSKFVPRFKEFEGLYKAQIKAKHRALQDLVANNSTTVDRNYYQWQNKVTHWAREFVLNAVYDAEDAIQWQIFRAALKGLTTQQKLFCLDVYLADARQVYESEIIYVDKHSEVTFQWQLERCRIDNYIGALRRGGQLDAQFRVVK